MIINKTILEATEELELFICDRCKKEINKNDIAEIQEVYSIRFIGGYGSIFGDCSIVRCD